MQEIKLSQTSKAKTNKKVFALQKQNDGRHLFFSFVSIVISNLLLHKITNSKTVSASLYSVSWICLHSIIEINLFMTIFLCFPMNSFRTVSDCYSKIYIWSHISWLFVKFYAFFAFRNNLHRSSVVTRIRKDEHKNVKFADSDSRRKFSCEVVWKW